MKKYYSILAILAISLVACNKESNSQVSSIHEALVENGLKYIEIAVSQEKPIDPETKATLSDVSMAFGPGDQIAVLATKDATTAPVTLTYLRYEDSKVIFGGSVDEEATISPYAYYPASIATSTERVINWPTTIDGSKVQVPMIAYLNKEAGSARFQHLGAIAKIAVANCPVGASKLKFTANTNITGGYTVSDFKTGTPIVSASGELTGATITATIDGNGTYYIPLPVNSSSGSSYANFQFALINSEETYYYKQKTATESFGPFARRNIVNFGTLTYDVDQIEEWYMICKLQKSPWTMSDKSIRFIKIADHQYRAATNNANDSGDYGYKIQYGSPASYSWDKTTGAKTANQSSGDLIENGNNCYYGTSNVIYAATINTSTWKYNNDYVNAADAFNFSTIDMVGDFNSWSTSIGNIRFDKGGAHNWSKSITVSSNTKVEFKIIANSQWEYGNWGGVNITDAAPYGTGTYRNTGDPDTARDSYTLTPGDYMVYFNDAKGDIMFVRQPYSE